MTTIPERIGKYQISEVLGRGSMGTVYKAFDPHIQRQVAIKTVHRELLGDNSAQDSMAARFRNEAKAVGRIQHPGVVAIYDFGEDGDVTFIAMEFVEGRTLDDILGVPQMLSEANLLSVMDQLLDALSVAHAQGVWHRDIKPANLIVTKAGRVKLTDFGVARLEDANLTQVSSMIGTPAYMAPEQFRGTGVDHRSDLFACGGLLYRMLTGRRAFTGSTEQVMYKILNDHPPAPSTVTDGARPAAFDAIVARALAKDPADRYQDAQAMRAALQAVGRTGAKATVILPLPATTATAPAAPATPSVVSASVAQAGSAAVNVPAASGTGVAPTGWDPAELSRIERALATHVGPLARVMVREAARTCSDAASLASTVSRHIPEEAKRQQFLQTTRAGGSQVTPVAPTASAATPLPAPAAGLTEDFKSRALQVLTRKMGPIARVMAKRAADASGDSRERFVQALVDALPEADRWAVQGELNKLP
jgi:predicted Ser/Thr protein kinase